MNTFRSRKTEDRRTALWQLVMDSPKMTFQHVDVISTSFNIFQHLSTSLNRWERGLRLKECYGEGASFASPGQGQQNSQRDPVQTPEFCLRSC